LVAWTGFLAPSIPLRRAPGGGEILRTKSRTSDRTHVYHLYTIRHPRRDGLAAHLNAHGVQTAINYPAALPFLEAYSRLKGRPEQFPNAHRDQGRILSLPMFAEITGDQQAFVMDLAREF
jgi:dTDP-4-amino-4,6-dideoxygalactose transaminase